MCLVAHTRDHGFSLGLAVEVARNIKPRNEMSGMQTEVRGDNGRDIRYR